MTVTVRRARLEDARTIADYAQKLTIQHVDYDFERFVQIADLEQMTAFYGSQTQAKDAAILIAELEGKIVGFAYIEFEAKNYAELLESAAWIHDIYIDESARGHDAGKNLIDSAKEIGREFGATKLMLSVASQNEFAKDFFEHRGFKTTMVEMMLSLTEKEDND